MKATVLLTSFNRPALIARAVLSVLRQDYAGEIELLICDDNSDMQTQQTILALLKSPSYQKKSRQIRLIQSYKENKWRRHTTDYARNINTGILASTGDVLFYLTDDDEFLESHVRLLTAELQTNKEATFVFGNQRVEQLNDNTLDTYHVGDRVYEHHILTSAPNIIDHNQFAHLASAVETVGLWPEHTMHYGACDGAFFDQVHKAGFVFYNATVPVDGKYVVTSRHRIHDTSVQGMMLKDQVPKW